MIAKINGIIKYGEISKGMRKISIVADDGEQRDYSIARGVHINVQEGERVRSGDPLMDGPGNPHDIWNCRSISLTKFRKSTGCRASISTISIWKSSQGR